jgi:hypothetical protein
VVAFSLSSSENLELAACVREAAAFCVDFLSTREFKLEEALLLGVEIGNGSGFCSRSIAHN